MLCADGNKLVAGADRQPREAGFSRDVGQLYLQAVLVKMPNQAALERVRTFLPLLGRITGLENVRFE